MTMLIYLVLVE